MMWLIIDSLATHTRGLYACAIHGLDCKFCKCCLQPAWSKAWQEQVAPLTPGAVLHCWASSSSLRPCSQWAAQLRAGPAAPRVPPALPGWFLQAPVLGFSDFLGWLFLSPQGSQRPTLEQCRREAAATKRDWKEKRADSRFRIPFSLWWSYEQHQWSLSQEQEQLPRGFLWEPRPNSTTCLRQAPASCYEQGLHGILSILLNPLVWEKRCSPIPVLAQQPEFVFPSWSGEHPTARAQRNTFYISVFHWTSIIFWWCGVS